jgi:Pyruvate/2-oxoglutarate dehydrogenase complex, dihydrolipoamide acyltransferase (E2) component, and related enzymes
VKKKNRRDRDDGIFVEELNDFNRFIPFITPSRIERQVYGTVSIDATNLLEYIAEKKATEGNVVTLYTTIVAALVRMIAIKPHMNRFVKGYRTYQREKIEVGHIAMASMDEDSVRMIHKTPFGPEADVFDVSNGMMRDIKEMKNGDAFGSNKFISKFGRSPRFYTKLMCRLSDFLDRHGRPPKAYMETDPFHSSVFVSNLGSIKCIPPLHHLSEYGTNSFFVSIGPVENRPAVVDGEVVARPFIDLVLTLDDAIADGFYFSNAVRTLRELLDDPRVLEERYLPKDVTL